MFLSEEEKPCKDGVFEMLNFVEVVVDDSGSKKQLGFIEKTLFDGIGADQQFKVFSDS